MFKEMTTYTYIRVSKFDQNIDRQILKIKEYAPELLDCNIFIDKRTGKNLNREQYKELKNVIKTGDVLILHELDRLGRNKEDIKQELEWYRQNGIRVKILNMPTTLTDYAEGQSWVGDMVNNILIEVYASLAEQERETISKRTKEGLEAARLRGNHPGRPIVDPDRADLAIRMYFDNYSINEIMLSTQLARATIYRYVRKFKDDLMSDDIGE